MKTTEIYNNSRPMSGVHFFVVRRINEVFRHMAITPNKPYKTLITPESTVYVIKDLINIIRVEKYTQKKVMKYQDNKKLTSLSSYNLIFEEVHDFQNPVDGFIPFIFTHCVSKNDDPIFENYMVIFNLRDFIFESNHSLFQQRKLLNNFLIVQKLNQYKGTDEKSNFTKSYKAFNQTIRSRGCLMFTRSSNFQKDIYETE